MTSSPEVVIIGSGIGGGTLTNRLVQYGLSLTILERGGFLPQELQNWDVASVFFDQKYVPRETWLDKRVRHSAQAPITTSEAAVKCMVRRCCAFGSACQGHTPSSYQRWRARELGGNIGFKLTITKHMGGLSVSHQCGTVRFGSDPSMAALNQFCRSFDHDICLLWTLVSSHRPRP
jgi:choline dehydrogenase-like flavoprotein